jgi:phospholipid/cholesterol/gamma-HCH transport system substrate-binding protein
MKFSKEAKIGLLVAISVLIFFAGFWFLKGSNIFSGESEYYAYYDGVQGLQPSAAVQIKGVNVGKVSSIKLDSNRVEVIIAMSDKTKLPNGTVARMISLDLLGTKAIRLELGTGPGDIADGATLTTDVESGIIDNLSYEISPLIADVRHVVGVLDSVLVGVDNMLSDQTRQNLSSSMASLNVTMQHFAELSQRLNRESEQLASAIRNINSITDNIAKNNESVDRILDNAAITTEQLKNAPIEQTIKELQSAAGQLNGLMTKINNGDGSVGMAFNDKQLYSEFTSALTTLQSLMADIEAHPSRYINVTIFGRKKK